MVILLIILLPAFGAALNGLLGVRWFGRTVTGAIACSAMAGAFALSFAAFVSLLGGGEPIREVILADWIPPIPLETAAGMGKFQASWGFRLDPLAAVMALVVTGVGFLIHVYSTAYMQDEARGAYARYFSYLNLFCFFMLVLVFASNLFVMFVGWEGVGLCSYLLIGFWYEKTSAADAGKKAFLVNRIGDLGFLLGIFMVFFVFGTLDFREVAVAVGAMPVETATIGVVSTICLLLFAGATGKSAQIPLYVWLPDAMEGPTPVSALIHAATMVTAGVYMVARNAALFSHAPLVMQIIAIVGALTALMAATIGLVQNDIKRVLAYSTVSQLGYMFLACGVGAFGAGIFHLMTHAFFKALLFLGSGSVIHAMAGEQDMQWMGGLKRYMPITFITMTIGTLAIAGIPPLAGFFSKDEILYQAFLHNRALWVLAAVTALLTAFYMARLMALTFYGTYRGPAWSRHASPDVMAPAPAHGVWHGPHEAPRRMTGPLVLLAIGASVAGFIGIPAALGGAHALEHFLEPSFTGAVPLAAGPAEAHPSRLGELALMLLSIGLAAAGILAARHVYVTRPGTAERLAARWSAVHSLLLHKYYVDELYRATIVKSGFAAARGLWTFDARVVDGAVNGSGWLTQLASWFSHMTDKYVVDGLVNLVGWTAGEGSYVLRRIQTGLVQNYALLMLIGVFSLVTLYLLAR